MSKYLLLALWVILSATSCVHADDWLTYYERSDYLETPRYNQTIDYCKKLADHSDILTYTTFGTSPQLRALPLLILDKDGEFDPTGTKTSGKAILLYQAGIHPGEIEGKDAGLMFLRDIVVHGKYMDMLDSVIVLFIPIFSVDGHERFGPYNRINQNGPKEMGWRVTSQNLNLNRDFLKADAPEMRSWLKFYTRWLPDFSVDLHTTNGADYQYVITYAIEANTNVAPALADWTTNEFVPAITNRMENAGYPFIRYIVPRKRYDITSGLITWTGSPRYSNGYGAVQNRPFMLIETHMLKSHKQRVESVYALMTELTAYVNENAAALKEAVHLADQQTATDLAGSYYPLRFQRTDDSFMIDFLGVDFHFEPSDISGTDRVIWGSEKKTYRIPFFYNNVPSDSVLMPYAYLIPPEWQQHLHIAQLHGVRIDYLARQTEVEVETYRLKDPKWKTDSYEGRHQLKVTVETSIEKKSFPIGTAVIKVNQRTNRLIAHLLEPKGPDSFISWGFFDAVTERKEYADSYVLEKLAREMLAEDSALSVEFWKKVETDSVFAASPRARLYFFYERSPYYDQNVGLYPVYRVMTPTELHLQ